MPATTRLIDQVNKTANKYEDAEEHGGIIGRAIEKERGKRNGGDRNE